MDGTTSRAAALHGIKVLDLSRVLAGPLAGQLLGDLGADVIKIERPQQGDDTRAWGPPYLTAAILAKRRISCARTGTSARSRSTWDYRQDGRCCAGWRWRPTWCWRTSSWAGWRVTGSMPPACWN
jgi:hypothetical protein